MIRAEVTASAVQLVLLDHSPPELSRDQATSGVTGSTLQSCFAGAIAKSFIQKATHGEMVSYITTHVTPHTAKTIHYNVRKISILFLTTVGNYIITLYGTDDTLYVRLLYLLLM